MGFLDYFKRAPAAPQAPALPAPADSLFGLSATVPRRTRGWSGTRIHSGKVTGHELNPALTGWRWACEARMMRRTDDAIAAGWHATLASLLSARWSWAPGDPEDGLSRQIASELDQCWSRLRRPWSRALQQALLYLPDGARYGEIAWGRGPTGRIDVIDAWVDREMTAHDRWLIEGDQWLGVQQRLPMGEASQGCNAPVIPADELVYLGHGVEGQNLDGTGLLRPIWHRWKQRVDVLDMSMGAVERWHQPVPMVSVDTAKARELGLTNAELEQQIHEVEQGIAAFLVGDAAYMRRTDCVRVETYGGDVKLADSVPLMDHLDGSILRGFLLQLLTLGTTSTGSRSVGEVHESIWRNSLLVPLDDVAEAYSGPARPGGGVAGRWCELNYGSIHPDRLPRLEHSGLSVDPLIDLIERLDSQKLSIFDIGSTRSDRDSLRRRMGLEPLPEPEPVPDAQAGVQPEDDDGEPDLPVKPGNYIGTNRDVADMLGSSTARINALVRRSVAAGIEVPAIGSGRDRRWDLDKVLAWYQKLTGGDS